MSYKLAFFSCLQRKLNVVEDWSYNGTKVRGDPDMPLPDGEDFDDEGKKSIFDFLIFIFLQKIKIIFRY